MDYVYEYLAFLAQAATVVVAILLVLAVAASLRARAAHTDKGHLEVRKLNDNLDALPLQPDQAIEQKVAVIALQ